MNCMDAGFFYGPAGIFTLEGQVVKSIIAGYQPASAGGLTQALNAVGLPVPAGHSVVGLIEAELLLSDEKPATVFWLVTSGDPENERLAIRRLGKHRCATVVAVGHADDSSEVLGYLRAGANEYLDLRADLVSELGELLNRLSDTREDVPKRGRVITVTSCGGGSGATTIAANVAAVLAERHERCALIDLHPYGGDLPAVLQLAPEFTLRDLARKGDSLDAALLHKSLVRHKSGIRVLSSPEPFSNNGAICQKTVKTIVSIASREFPFVVVDGEDLFHPEQRIVMEASDQIVLVLRLDFASLVRAKKGIQHLTSELKIAREKIQLVAARCGQPRELPIADAENVLGHPLASQIPNDPGRALAAINIGFPVVSEYPNSDLSRSLHNLAALLSGEMPSTRQAFPPTLLRGLKGNLSAALNGFPFFA